MLSCVRPRKSRSIQATEKETANSAEHEKIAARYFQLALQYAVRDSQPLTLVVMGRVGTGKTTVALQLGRELNWPVFSSDETRKTLAGIPLMERTAPDRREEIYSDPITKQTYAKLVGDGLAAAKAHGGAVLDATFSRRANRDFLREQCRRAHARLEIVELDVDLATIRTRLAARNRSAGETSDARLEDLEKLTAAYEPPTELFNSLIQVPARGPILETTKSILLRLSRKRLS